MTANQVAYELGSRSAAENERHNQAVEALNVKLYDLQAEKNAAEIQYNKDKNSIQEKYNEAYMNYLNASQDWKQVYENDMNRINEMKVTNEAAYRDMLNDYNIRMSNIEYDKQKETERFNKATEEWRSVSNELVAKDIQYHELASLNEASARELNLAQQRLAAVELNDRENQRMLLESQARLRELEIKQQEADVREAEAYVKAGTGVISTFLNFLSGRR